MPRAEVVFYGSSLYLSGLAFGLQPCGSVHLIQLKSDAGKMTEELKMLRPDVVVFELSTPNLDQVLQDFLAANPRVRLIGLDPEQDSLTVLSGKAQRTASVNDLGLVILEESVS